MGNCVWIIRFGGKLVQDFKCCILNLKNPLLKDLSLHYWTDLLCNFHCGLPKTKCEASGRAQWIYLVWIKAILCSNKINCMFFGNSTCCLLGLEPVRAFTTCFVKLFCFHNVNMPSCLLCQRSLVFLPEGDA